MPSDGRVRPSVVLVAAAARSRQDDVGRDAAQLGEHAGAEQGAALPAAFLRVGVGAEDDGVVRGDAAGEVHGIGEGRVDQCARELRRSFDAGDEAGADERLEKAVEVGLRRKLQGVVLDNADVPLDKQVVEGVQCREEGLVSRS